MKIHKIVLFFFILILIFSPSINLFFNFNYSDHNTDGSTHLYNDFSSIKPSSPVDVKYLWNKTWGGNNSQSIDSLALDSDQNIYSTGTSTYEKFDSIGNLLLNGETNAGVSKEILVDPLGNIYIAGYVSSDIWLAKLNSSGSQLWNITWDSGGGDYCYDLDLDSNYNIYIFGEVVPDGINSRYCLIKFNENGIQQWNKTWRATYPPYYVEYGQVMHIDSNDNIYAVGICKNWNNHSNNFHLMKFNTTGDLQWETFYSTWIFPGFMYDIICDSIGNIYISGGKSNSSSQSNIFLLKYNSEGLLLWDTLWTSCPLTYCWAMALDHYGDIYVAGVTKYVGAGGWDMCVLKYNQSGAPEWYYTWGGVDDDWCYDIVIDSSNGIYLGGTTENFGAIGFDNCLVKLKSVCSISIEDPIPNQIYGVESPSFALSFSGSQIDKSWYSVNNGENYFFEGTNGKIDQDAWNSCENGTVILKFFVNDTFGSIETEEVVVRRDIIEPDIIIKYPLLYQTYSNKSPNFEISIDEPNFDHSWYTLDGGINNYTFSGDFITINQNAWDGCLNGTVVITFYAIDTVGNLGSETIEILKDISAPYIEIVKPEPFKMYGKVLNYEIAKFGTNINSTWYTINNGLKYEFNTTVGEINLDAWNSADDGIVLLKIFINDSYSREVISDVRIFKDATDPTIMIISPLPNIFFSSSSPNYEVNIFDINLNSTWYTMDGGLTNITLTENLGKIDQAKWSLLEDGNITIRFYANDSVNNLVFEDVTVRKDATKPVVSINSPVMNELIIDSSPTFNISINEINLNESWYTLNNGLKHFINTLIGVINQSAWDNCSDGYVDITFYAKDFSGNLGNASVQLRKNLDSREAYAIIIGISDYPGSGYDLNYCDDDAIAVYNMLINDYNFKPENIIYLQDSSAAKSSIDNAFDTIAALIDPGDIFFFYYSGHGGFGTYSTQGSWNVETLHPYWNNYDQIWSVSHPGALYMRVHFERFQTEDYYDYALCGNWGVTQGYYYQELTGNLGTNFWSSYIPVSRYYIRFISDSSITSYGFKIDKYEAILQDGTHYLCSYDSLPSNPSAYYMDTLLDSKLDLINCEDKYVVLDSCNSGGLIPEVQDIGRYIMTACRGTEESLETSILEHGIFTNYLLESKENANDQNEDGAISMEECYDYVYSHTVSDSGSYGSEYQYHPEESDGIVGESVLYPSLGQVNYTFSDNRLNYSFFLYGHGMLKTVNLTVCSVEPVITFNTFNLKYHATSITGFGYYEGTLEIDPGNIASGFVLNIEIEGNRVIKINKTFGDSDGDGLTDIFEILEGSGLNPSSNDTDSDGLNDYDEFYGPTDPLNNDTDSDGLLDGEEVNIYGTDPLLDDTDSDGLTDYDEINIHGTDPLSDDTDSDGLTDSNEINLHGTDPLLDDTDSDGLTDGEEVNTYGTDPLSDDTDSDGLSDYDEVIIHNTDPLIDDTDSDGLTDYDEINIHGTDPLLDDTDSDGLLDGEEINLYNTNPFDSDTDSDILSDYDEVYTYFTDPLINDTDSDGLLDGEEVNNFNTDPLSDDTDSDGLTDYDEIFIYFTNPLLDDTDSDGLTDQEEIVTYNTDPLNDDTDSDGLTDYDEVITHGTDPLDDDTDSDTMPDGWEIDNLLDPFTNDTALDPDNDLLTNLEEFQLDTLPMNNDTDSDGLLDGEEVFTYYTSPTIEDTDSDGLLDGDEVNIYNTDPLDDDTDSDGLLDGAEVNIHGTDPLSEDSDSDTMPDGWEVDCSLNPLIDDAELDPDNDDLVNILEYQHNTDPQDPDTDLDGWTDGDEVLVYDTDPLDPFDHPDPPPTPSPAAIPGYHIIVLISIVGGISLVLIKKKKFKLI